MYTGLPPHPDQIYDMTFVSKSGLYSQSRLWRTATACLRNVSASVLVHPAAIQMGSHDIIAFIQSTYERRQKMAGVLKPQMNIISAPSKAKDSSNCPRSKESSKEFSKNTVQLLDYERDQQTFENDILKHLQDGVTNLRRL